MGVTIQSIATCSFFQAKDGIRDSETWLEFRRVLFRSIGPVVRLGVWQSTQPAVTKSSLPRPIEALPPGVSGEGVGGARNFMKKANFWMPLLTSGALVMSRLVVSFGTGANWQF